MQNPEDKLSFSCQKSSEAYLPIVEVPCMANWGSLRRVSTIIYIILKTNCPSHVNNPVKPIIEVPCMAYLGIPACTVFPFSATIKHGVL